MRIEAKNPRGILERIARRFLAKRGGKVPHSIGILGHNPRILAAFLAYGAFFESSKELPERTRRLVHLRVSMRIGCPT